ncbi:MAG TPA: helix-turn-helix transcriptional regulator [Bacteroidia bacterium]|nr:helix-turn-helix transcriptional regulator [Bacteroidia bacterium]
MDHRRDKILGRKLFKLRKFHNLSQKACFEALGLRSQQDLSDLEHGEKSFTIKLVHSISAYFNISPVDFQDLRNSESLYVYETIITDKQNIKRKPDTKLELVTMRKLYFLKELELIKAKKELYLLKQKLPPASGDGPPIYVLL